MEDKSTHKEDDLKTIIKHAKSNLSDSFHENGKTPREEEMSESNITLNNPGETS